MKLSSTATIFGITLQCILISFLLTGRPGDAYGSPNNAACLMCHSAKGMVRTFEGRKTSLYVDTRKLSASIHKNASCVDCHADLRNGKLPHGADLQPAQCVSCHEESHRDGIHAGVAADRNPPKCQECHGSHGILQAMNPGSPVHPKNSEAVCAKCHAEDDALVRYRESVHGLSTDRSGLPAAGCTDCHHSHSGSKASSPTVCGKCHVEEQGEFLGGEHGAAFVRGDMHAPTCVDCHDSHGITELGHKESPVHSSRIANVCSKCHADEEMMAKYDLPADVFETYLESYHGKALMHGDLSMPTCVSCHGSHRVLPSSDPRSSANRANLPETCGECHGKLSPNVAEGKVHVSISREDSSVLYYVSNGFKWLTIGTMAALIGHILIHLYAQIRDRRRAARSVN